LFNSILSSGHNQLLLPTQIPDLSPTLGLFPDFSLTLAEFPDISRFPEKVVNPASNDLGTDTFHLPDMPKEHIPFVQPKPKPVQDFSRRLISFS